MVTEGLGRLMEPDTTHVHVTISEAAEEGCLAFFESIGFRRKAVEPNRYRRGVDEFIYSCPAGELAGVLRDNLSRGVERTLFGTMPKTLPQENTLLMSLRPEFAELMLRHRKTVEFRRKFSTKHVGARVIFYVTHPVRQFLFMATIANVDHRPKKQLWTTHRAEGGVSKELFDHYFSGMENGYAIRLDNLQPIPNQLYLRDAQRVCPALRPPQSFQALEPQSPLLRALDLPVNV
ncbi:MAG TPA: hypothetical protein DCX07_01160 [Phycisphaerales bacterium]|nr:hypothetical protein [Phycisphaerales bacterium]